MMLTALMHDFFDRYQAKLLGASPQTIKTYRSTFGLFLRFLQKHQGGGFKELTLEHITFERICDFLDDIERECGCSPRTRNLRLATLRSFARMMRLLHPDVQPELSAQILSIPTKRVQKTIVGHMMPDEVRKVLNAVDLTRSDGCRDFTLLLLLYNSGARASEAAGLQMDSIDYENETLGIVGKGNRYRVIKLWPKTIEWIEKYMKEYRRSPHPQHQHTLFVSQRGHALTRHGINRICRKYLTKVVPTKKLQTLSPVHCFRHSCAVRLLMLEWPITDIANFLGHEDIKSTMVYLKMDLSVKQAAQKCFIDEMEALIGKDSSLDGLVDWEHRRDTLEWLDSI
jgi:integrase/recombinase XerD